MDCTRRLFGAAVASVGVLAFARVAFAAHQHHPAHQLLGNKINTDGKHELHKRGDHTIHAHVKGKKISHISVTHKTKGEVAVKKYKSKKKMAQLGAPGFAAGATGSLVEPVSYQVAQTIVWTIGWAYNDAGEEYYYWFPEEMVVDPYTGAVEYVPVT
jgi:hypothetical protein